MKWLLILIFAALVAVHPWIEATSDSEDAIEIVGQAALRGENPYLLDGKPRLTVAGNPMTPTLGYVILFGPFVFASHMLSIGLVMLWIACQRPVWQIPLLLLVLKITATGSDYVFNAVACAWALRACVQRATVLAPGSAGVLEGSRVEAAGDHCFGDCGFDGYIVAPRLDPRAPGSEMDTPDHGCHAGRGVLRGVRGVPS